MNNKARWMAGAAPGYEVGGRRMPTSEEIYQHECRMYAQEQRHKAAFRARYGAKVADEVERTARKVRLDMYDEAAIARAERNGDINQVNLLRAKMTARRLGVDV